MENLISIPAVGLGAPRRIMRTLGLTLVIAVAVLSNLGDRAFTASTANKGIDPLQILDTGVQNNILFMLSQSETLSGTPQGASDIVGGDDPASRWYQVKRAVRDIITLHGTEANLGLASFQPSRQEHFIEGSKGLVYVTQDPDGDLFRNNFTAPPAVSGAMTVALGTSFSTTSNSTSYSTSAWTPSPNALLVVFAVASPNGSNPAADPSGVTGHGGLTYSKITAASKVLGTDTTLSVWVAKGNATNGTVTVTYPSNRTNVGITEYQVLGADVSGTALAAVVQAVTGGSNSSSTSAPVTMAGSANSGDAVMYFLATGGSSAITAQAGWTDGDGAANLVAGSNAMQAQYKTTFSATANATISSTTWAGAAIEFKVAPPITLIDHCSSGTCTATESSGLFALMASNDAGTSAAYPVGCTNASANRVDPSGTVNGPATHVLGDVSTVSSENSGFNCRYYIRSKLLLNGYRYSVTRGAAATAAFTATSAIPGGCAAVLPPAGLLGDDTLSLGNGTLARACFQIKDNTTNRILTYWMSGAQFIYQTITDPGISPAQCNESGIRVAVDDCEGATSPAQISEFMKLELQYDSSGAPIDLPALTLLNTLKPGNAQSPIFSTTGLGLRLGTGSPITKSLQFALNYFQTTVLPAAGTTKRPLEAQGKQRQYVVLIVDADDSCNTLAEAKTAAYNLWSNTAPALPACTGTCLTAKNLTAAQWAAANRIELVIIPYGGGTQASIDAISEAGTGLNPATGICDAGASCRVAPIARNVTELNNRMREVIYQGSVAGEYSDQQSVTETVFEFASLATPSKDPLDPNERYAVSVPVLMQSTFELPGFLGHLNAFRRSNNGTVGNTADDLSVQEWDAGQKLCGNVSTLSSASSCTPASGGTATPLGGMTPGTAYSFAQLYGDGTTATIKTSTAKIKRRIYTTTQNGVNNNYTVSNLINATVANLAWTRVALWPPTPTTATTLTSVAPTTTFVSGAPIKGILDTAMGFDAWTTVAQVQAAVQGVCQGSVTADIHADCTSATAGLPLARAKREAREITLAYIAGAKVKFLNGLPVRNASTKDLQYEVRPWILAESTLAAPGVVTPPLLAGPTAAAGAVGVEEYKMYRDGPRATGTLVPVNAIANGLGLRNPDRVDASAAQSVIDAAAADINLKPSMSVVYHATNQGLHAFRAGRCPVPPAGSGINAATIPCSGETGGEELWAFVPYDLLAKLPALTISQTRADKQYLLASPVRFADIFVPGTATFSGTSYTGVWRTILYFGRGAGGKYYTALDVTTPGPFTKHSLTTSEPIVVWNRGNPDTTKGLPCATGVHNNTATTADCPLYSKLGETWSVPSVGFVTAANYTTTRSGSSGLNFALFTGSGFSDVSTEGKTFFVLDALTGDIVRNFDIADGTVPAQTPTLTNFLVASPVVYAEDASGNSPSGYNYIGNPVATKAKTVYFPDIHGRVWRYNVASPATAPVQFFAADTASVGNQPFGTPVSVLQNRPDPGVPGEVLVFAEAGYDRRVAIDAAKPFKAYAWKDDNGSKTDMFRYAFPASYRGTTQPASAFAGSVAPLTPVVFFAGIKFNQSCASTFDSILVALKAVIPADIDQPEAAFDLKATGDDSFIELTGKKVNAIRVSGEGSLVVDQGLNAQEVPPPPGVAVPTVTIPGSTSLVKVGGLTPGSADYKDLVATTEPYRIGSAVCKVQ